VLLLKSGGGGTF